MGIFDKKKSEPLPALISDEELEESLVNYNTVLDWLVGLSDQDYEKVHKVANIYRNANKDACSVLGVKDEPTTFINDPKDELQTIPPVIIDKEPEFLELDEPKSKKVKVTVKSDKKAK